MGAAEALRARLDEAVLDGDVGAHCPQPGDVQVDRPRADRTTARQGDVSLAKAGHERAEHQDRGAHGLDEFVGRLAVGHRARIGLDVELLVHRDLHTHHLQQREGGCHILEMRHIADSYWLAGQQGTAKYRQRGVLRAGYGDRAG